MKLFLSYSSEHKERVAEVNYALEVEKHSVFFDRDELPPGAGYHARIRSAIEECELFIFFITPQSVAPGRYTLTELKFVRDRWENPEHRVLPVMLEPTPMSQVHPYLKAVNMLEPQGNLAAEVVAEVAALAKVTGAEPTTSPAPAPGRTGMLEAPSYAALRIAFHGSTASGYALEATEAPGGPVAAQSCRIDPSEVESLLWSSGTSRELGLQRAGSESALPDAEGVRRVGEHLYEALFSTHLEGSLEDCLDTLDPQRGAGVRFVINTTDAPELGSIPWEFTYRRSDDDFLFSNRLTPLVRWLDLRGPLPTLAVEPPLRLLVAVAAPRDQPQLSVGDELASLDSELAELAADGILEPIHLQHASLESLDKALVRNAPHVLHFIGHGDFQQDEGVLMLESEEKPGSSAPISGRRLAVLLRNHLSTLRLVFLNSCLGAAASPQSPFSSVAQSLMRKGMPAVIAMQFPIPDRAAVTLAREFYRYLAAGLPVDAALTSARAFLFAKGYAVEWGAPALHMRTPDAQLFAIPGAPEPVVVAPEPAPPAPAPSWLGAALGRVGKPAVLALVMALVAVGVGLLFFRSVKNGQPAPPDSSLVEMITLPDLAGAPVEEVRRRLADLGFSTTLVEVQSKGGESPGTVLEMFPTPGPRVPKGSNIHLSVAALPEAGMEQEAGLIVDKRLLGAGRRPITPEDFTLLVDGNPVPAGEWISLARGTHVVSERGGPRGFRASFSGDCGATGRVSLEPGDRKTCTITNDYTAALRPVASGGSGLCKLMAAVDPGGRLTSGILPLTERMMDEGGPCRFAPEPATTAEDLRRLFVQYENDLRQVLELAQWAGDPDDLFAALQASALYEVSMPPGTEAEWAAFRWDGKPISVQNILWKADAVLPAWSLRVYSNGINYTFVVPKTSFGLWMIRGATRSAPPSPPPPQPSPACDLTASFDAGSNTITLSSAAADLDLEVTGVREPDGAGLLDKLEPDGENTWLYKPTADGTYSFTATARNEATGERTACSARVEVERRKPAPSGEGRPRPRTQPPGWIARGSAIWVEPSSGADGGPGLGLGLEYRLRARLGLEATVAFADLDGDQRLGSDELQYRHLTAGVNFHPSPDGRADFYLGPVIGLVRVGGGFDEDFAWGVNLGLDISLRRWEFSGGVRYLDSSHESGASGFDLDLDPVVISAGLSYRF